MRSLISELYILDDDDRPLQIEDIVAWASWRKANRHRIRVARDDWDDVTVSTVFTGIDYNWGNGPDPLVYETAVFRDRSEKVDVVGRYSDREVAILGHMAIVSSLKGS